MVIALHCNIGVRSFGVFFLYREVSCVTIIYNQDFRILRVVGGSGVTWRFRAGIPICDHSQHRYYHNPNPNYSSKNIPERLSANRGETQSDDRGPLRHPYLTRVCQPGAPSA
jgi:hypothetical protein